MCDFLQICRGHHEDHLLNIEELQQQCRHWDRTRKLGAWVKMNENVLGYAARHQTHHAIGLVSQDAVLLGNQHRHALGFKCQKCTG